METKIMVKVANGWAGEGDIVRYKLTGESCKILDIEEAEERIEIASKKNRYFVNWPEHLEFI